MSEWQTYKISQLGRVVTGNTPSSNNPRFFGDEYPFITPSDMDGVQRFVETERHLSSEGYKDQLTRLLPQHAISIVCIGATIGKICMTSIPSFTNQQINSIVVDDTTHDPFFIYYALQLITNDLKSIAGGTATPIVNKSTFSEINIVLPPLETQRRIAAILSAYDDLIENNTRRIKALEQAAHDLYREWFVEFRFPGHESVELVDSGTDYGMIPQGWEVVQLGELADMKYGKMPEKDKRQDIGYPIFSGYGIVGHYTEYLYEEPKITIVARGVGGAGNVVMSPPYSYVTNLAIVISGLKKNIQERFLYHRLIDTTLWSLRTGSAQAQITIEHLSKYEILSPFQQLQDSFTKKVIDLETLAGNLQQKNNALREAREVLLPRLVSGQVDVSQVDIKGLDE